MNTIRLQQLMPSIFAQRTDIAGDVWGCEEVCLERGQTYLLEANSGTGKSSLCSFLFGYRADYHGCILFDEQDAHALRAGEWARLRRQSLALLWQDLRLFPELTAWENVQVKNQLTRHQRRGRLQDWFDRLGIADKQATPVARLSFGQQQRVAFIRSLCQPFQFILLDEPISHLDEANALLMAAILEEEARRQGAGILVTSIGRRLQLNYTHHLHL